MQSARSLIIATFLTASLHAAQVEVGDVKALSEAMKAAQPGDEILLRDGRWTDQKLVARGNGTKEKPITLRAATPGRTILDGGSLLRIAGQHLVVSGLWFQPDPSSGQDTMEFRADSKMSATNCLMTGCAFTAPAASSAAAKENRWVGIYGTSNAVTHCYLAGKSNRGTTLVVWVKTNAPGHHTLVANHFGPRPDLGKNGGETIRIGTSTESLFPEHATVEGNLFTRCNGEVEIISNKSCGNTYRANTFIECAGALTLRHGNGCRVDGNVFLGNNAPNSGGIRIIGEDHVVVNNYLHALTGSDARSALTFMNGLRDTPLNGYVAAARAVVAYNSIIDCRVPIHVGLSDAKGAEPPNDCMVANNLIRSGAQKPVKIETPPLGMRWLNNFYEGKSLPMARSEMTPGELKLVLDDAGLWRPGPDSPVIGAGLGEFPQARTDMDGQPRPDRLADVGADQVSSGYPLRRPLAPGDVGPSWMADR